MYLVYNPLKQVLTLINIFLHFFYGMNGLQFQIHLFWTWSTCIFQHLLEISRAEIISRKRENSPKGKRDGQRAFTFQYTQFCIKSVEASFEYDQLRNKWLFISNKNWQIILHKKKCSQVCFHAFFLRVFTTSTQFVGKIREVINYSRMKMSL